MLSRALLVQRDIIRSAKKLFSIQLALTAAINHVREQAYQMIIFQIFIFLYV